MIISNKNGMYELPIDLRLRILGNQEIPGKSQNFLELKPSAESSSENESLLILPKNFLKKEIELLPYCATTHEN